MEVVPAKKILEAETDEIIDDHLRGLFMHWLTHIGGFRH